MAKPDLEWTIENAPHEEEAWPTSASGGGAGSQRPGVNLPRRKRQPWPRWAWLALLGLTVSAIAGAYVFTQLGWQRVEQQIRAEVAYDDAQSRVGAVEAVLAAQVSNDDDWRAQRTAEVALSLPAPLPAGNLVPTTDPAEVLKIEALSGGLVAATVRRHYADADGQVTAFDLVQRYLNVAPGKWQRLGTDRGELLATTIVPGQRLTATVPTNDLPWLRPALEAADHALSAACDAWQTCPNDYQLPVIFNTGPELLDPARPERYAEVSADTAIDPIIFDIPAFVLPYPPKLRLSAPQVVGRPADAEAQAAYTRALSAQVLGAMAGLVTQAGRANNDYFLDAIIARMEERLGLSAATVSPAGPLNFVPAEIIWGWTQQPQADGDSGHGWDRRQELALMNLVLEGQPTEVEGALLRALHRPDALTLEGWLATALGPEAAARAVSQWRAAAEQGLEPATPAAWQAAEGLALMCADQLALVEGGALRQVAAIEQSWYLGELYRSVGAVRYLAATAYHADNDPSELWIFDLTGQAEPVRVSAHGYGAGWGADGALYFVSLNQDDSPLQRYDPATGSTTTVVTGSVYALEGAWTAAHDALLISVYTGSPYIDEQTETLTLVTLGPPTALRPLTENDHSPVLAPGSTATQGQVAFLSYVYTYGEVEAWPEIHVLDLATGIDRLLVASKPAHVSILNYGPPRLAWLPGGTRLSLIAYGPTGTRLFLVDAASGAVSEWPLTDGLTGPYPFPVGFSADDRFLALRTYYRYAEIELLDLAAPGAPARQVNGESLAWAPSGHTLALSNVLGVFLVDAATGDYQRLQAEPCTLYW